MLPRLYQRDPRRIDWALQQYRKDWMKNIVYVYTYNACLSVKNTRAGHVCLSSCPPTSLPPAKDLPAAPPADDDPEPEPKPSLPPRSPPPVAPPPPLLGLEPLVNATACCGTPDAAAAALPLDAGEDVGANVPAPPPTARVAGEDVGVKVAGEAVGVNVAGDVVGVNFAAGEVVGVNVGLLDLAALPCAVVEAAAAADGGGG